MKILVLDIGGTNVKVATQDQEEIKIPSGPTMTSANLVEQVLEATKGWKYEAVTIGYPGPVVHGKIAREPHNLAEEGWVGYDFAGHFQKPVRIINDAAMQALGSYDGGRMLFLGLGTGLGSAMVIDKCIVPMELAHLPYRKGRSYEDYVGNRGLKRLGRKRWEKAVLDVVGQLRAALVADYVVLGGGNTKRLSHLPHGARQGDNRNAILGGYRLWEDYKEYP